MTRRRRIWCELLPPSELGAEATVSLLDRYGLEPIVALPPDRETEAMAKALERLSARRIRVGIWPLLSDADGYWFSANNADRFSARVHAALAFARRAGAEVHTIAIDLEPPLEVTAAWMRGGLLEKAALAAGGLRSSRAGAERSQRAQSRAAEALSALERALFEQKIETLAAVIPTVILDWGSGTRFWQSLFQTPVDGARWSVVSPMLYTTLIAAALPATSIAAARALLYGGARLAIAHADAGGVSVSLGLVGAGKLGDEPVFRDPSDLLRDVEAALSAGAEDLALFSLEGVLARGPPEAWLDPFTRAEAKRPSDIWTGAVSGLVRATTWIGRRAHRGSPLVFLRRPH